MVERGEAAKPIFDVFALRIKEPHDLQRQDQNTRPAEHPPSETVAALNPSEPASELANITQ